MEKDVGHGLAILEEACALGEGKACHGLGRRYRDGADVPASPFRALDFFELACKKNYVESCLAVADMYEGEKWVAAEPARVPELRRLACTRRPEPCPDAGPHRR